MKKLYIVTGVTSGLFFMAAIIMVFASLWSGSWGLGLSLFFSGLFSGLLGFALAFFTSELYEDHGR